MMMDTLRVSGRELNRLQDLLLLRPAGTMMVHVIGQAEDGLFGESRLVLPGMDDLGHLARSIDEGEDDVTYPVIQDDFSVSLIGAALFPPNVPPHFSAQQISALRSILEDHIPPQALELIRSMHPADPSLPLLDKLRFLSAGDVEARCQALRSYPLLRGALTSEEACNLIDRREPLLPFIARLHRFTPAEARKYSQIEFQIGALIRHPAPRQLFPQSLGRLIDSPDNAALAARIVSAQQLPGTPEGTMAMLETVEHASRQANLSRLGMRPFVRLLRRVGPEDWPKAQAYVQKVVSPAEMRDYLLDASKAVLTAVIVDGLRREGVDFARLSRTAETLWEKQPVSGPDAIYLSTFLEGMQSLVWCTGRLGLEALVIGEMTHSSSLKGLRELEQRWHHTQGTLRNQVLATSDPVEWRPLLGTVELPDGLIARELSSTADLERQGKAERHCVGGYASVVLGAASARLPVIFSIEKDGEILSTVEMVGQGDGRREERFQFSINQNKAKRNEEPSEAARNAGFALRTILNGLPGRDVRLYLNGVGANPGNLLEKLQYAITTCRGNITNGALPERILETYSCVLPKNMKPQSIKDWQDLVLESAEGTAPSDRPRLQAEIRAVAKTLSKLAEQHIVPDEPEEGIPGIDESLSPL